MVKNLELKVFLLIFYRTYKDTLFNGTVVRTKVHMLRSIRLQLYNIMQERLAFSPVCCSRFLLLPNGVQSLPFGHYSIPEGEVETVLEDNE
jgi:hypothetical protein